MTIVEFIEARLAEDEAIARKACIPARVEYSPHPELTEWFYEDGDEVQYVQTPEMLSDKYAEAWCVTMDSEGLSPAVDEKVGPHIARHDPARVLREVEALRAVLISTRERNDQIEGFSTTEEMVADDLAPIAAIWSDHPDYRAEWA